MKIEGLHNSRIKASKERKSLSGAIKTAKMNMPGNNEFWKLVAPYVKKNDVDPKWITEHATEKQLNVTNKDRNLKKDENGKLIPREKFTAWGIQEIIKNHIKTL